MTFADVKRKIFNLGFEQADTYEEDPTILTDALNSAMRQITNLFPLIGEYKIAQNPLSSVLPGGREHLSTRHYDGVNPLTYHASGAKSLYFECSGTGTLTVTDEDGTRTIELTSDRAFVAYRQFVRGEVSLTFAGAFSYDIKSIAVYSEAYSEKQEDIPAYRQSIRYDFKKLTAVNDVPVFIDFLEEVQEANGGYAKIKDFQVERRSVLVLDGFSKAEYTVFYSRNFVPFTPETPDDFEIQLDFDKEELLPLLASWYVWEEDEPTRAAKWRNDYEDLAARLFAAAKPETAEEKFINSLGW